MVLTILKYKRDRGTRWEDGKMGCKWEDGKRKGEGTHQPAVGEDNIF